MHLAYIFLQDVDFITESVALSVSIIHPTFANLIVYKLYRLVHGYIRNVIYIYLVLDSQFAFIINWFLF